MAKYLALLLICAGLIAAIAGCGETKDPHEPNLKGQPDPRYPRPGVGIGGGPPPQPPSDQKAGETKGDDAGKSDEGKADEGKSEEIKSGETKEGEKGPGASAGVG